MQNSILRRFTAHAIMGLLTAALLCTAAGCPDNRNRGGNALPIPESVHLQAVNFTDTARPTPNDQPIVLSAARNEWTSFTLQVEIPAADGYWLRLHPLISSTGGIIPISSYSAFEVLSMPVDMDRAGYVRHTDQPAVKKRLPRALLPQPMEPNGTVNLASLRNPRQPTDPRSRAGGPGATPATLWFDVHVPKGIPAEQYSGLIDLMSAKRDKPVLTLPLRVTVYDFELPDERHLQMVGKLDWNRLEKLYPSQFETFTPSWINRREGRYQATVRTLDHLVALAQENRANLVVPELKPVVKWPAGEGPRIDWGDFDSMVRPWFSGDAFGDHMGLRFWPLPEAELLKQYDRPSQLQYWTEAARHFETNEWIGITAAAMESPSPDRVTHFESIKLCADAMEVLNGHPHVRVLLPVETDQVQLADASNPTGINPTMTSRLLAASPGLVSAPPLQPWPKEIERPRQWLRTDLPGLVPYIGAGGDDRDVRVWAWLAFLRHFDPARKDQAFEQNFILWDSSLPRTNDPEQPADPGELAWFYPGEWFGIDLPVPTVQLKWLRRAQQDYEYLLLAQDRGEVINAMQMARLIAKPVEIQPGQAPDPVYALMTGTSSQQAWDDAHRLLADTILLRKPEQQADPVRQQELYIRTLQWAAPQERPLLLGRTTKWSWSPPPTKRRDPGTWIDLDFGVDIYNASDTTPDENRLRWQRVPRGWEIRPQEQVVPRLETYRVLRTNLQQSFNLDHVGPASREPMELGFVNRFTQVISPLKVMLPVASSDKREGRLSIDGTLEEWSAVDAIHDGPLVKMVNRPALQRQELQLASTNSTLYSSWGRENFYMAFGLEGLAPDTHRTQNFVNYDHRRAWGEDLCEVLIQPIYANNEMGPVLHVVCKPNGGVWVERKQVGPAGDFAWKALETAGIRYAATTPEQSWRGEVAIPWAAITAGNSEQPILLRFNFAQHRAATGESDTWSGPVDFGRDDSFMGLLYLRTPGQRPGDGLPRPRSE